MDKKVAIITICDNSNYGNRLQNYALHRVISNLGVDSVTLWDKKENTIREQIKLFIKKIVPTGNIDRNKYTKFQEFTRNRINNYYIDLNDLNKINDKFDYFIVGSDQIWNYNFGHAKDKDFLKFSDYNKTISYAPSFGISNIDEEWKEKIYEGVNHIKYLSVRENRGSEIIKELTNRDAQVVLDPTLLLSKSEWCEIQKKPKNMIKEKYILTYFLGEKSEKLKFEIDKISIENNLKIINLYDIEDEKFYACGPSEFLYLFNHAELVLTDSFHACVFSMIFNKSFYVFDRNSKEIKSMNSRLDTLLSTFKQDQRKVNTLDGIKDVFECDYSESYEVLKVKQKESMDFLKNALGICDKQDVPSI